MSATAKIRLGAAVLVAGEVFGLVTQEWARASTFVGFVGVGGALIALGAALGTWGVVQLGQRG